MSTLRLVTFMAVAIVASWLVASGATASELCKTHRGGLLIRDTCKPREEVLDPPALDALGLRGPAGQMGPPGPPGGGLHVVDANGSDVGVVIGLTNYYGQYARVAREMLLPGGTGPEFITFSVTPQGLRASDYACSSYYGTYYPNPDCTGDQLQQCEYGNCSSAESAFLYQSVSVKTGGTACFARGGSEFERGDFYRQSRVSGSSIDQAVNSCTNGGGTLIGPIAPCFPGANFFCGECCVLDHNVGVAPLHQFDLNAAVGTPPLRLSR